MPRLFVSAFILIFCKLATAGGETANLKARRLIDQQQLQAALSVLDQALQDEPKSGDGLYLRGYILYRLHDLDRAKLQLEEVTQFNPPALRAQYLLGRIAMLQGRPEEAVAWLTKAANDNPPIEDSPAQLSKALLDAHQLEASRKWTEVALKITPWDGSLHYRLARIDQQLGRPEAAEREFQESIRLKGADREAVQKLVASSRQLSSGEIALARETRDSFLKQPKLDPDLLVALGSSFAAAGLTDDSVQLFTEGAQRDPSSFQANFDLGLAFLHKGLTAQAILPLEAALRIAPSSVECNSALASGFVMLSKFQDALPRLELVHSVQPENVRTEGLLALTYLRTGSAEKAIPLIKDSITKQSGDAKLYFLLIECLNSAEKPAEALAAAEQAVQRFPLLAKSHLAKAQQLSRLGRYEEAGPSFAKSVELAPGELEPLLGLAEVQNKSGAYSDSHTTYQRVLALDPKSLTAQLGSAKNLIALGKLPEATDVLREAAADHSDSLQVHFELSRIYMREGARDDADRETGIVQKLRASQPQ